MGSKNRHVNRIRKIIVNILNIAGYQFVSLSNLKQYKQSIQALAEDHQLKGTVLLSPEGINIMLSGIKSNVLHFMQSFSNNTLFSLFSGMNYKQHYSESVAFDRLLIKIKKEIIAFGVDNIDPIRKPAKYIQPVTLKQWLDENRDIYLLDTRNDYEIAEGTFKNAITLPISHFRDFPDAAKNLDENLKKKPVVTFCTGGIRCEKAALLLEQYGFEEVYQLKGGILDYFLFAGTAHYEGDCFVFDKRESIAG